MEKLVIIGSGSAGYTAAIYAARANLNPLLYVGLVPGGLLTTTTEVENYPGFATGIQGYDLMEAMRQQAERFGTRMEHDIVTAATLRPGGPHTLTLSSGATVETEALIIATGASHRKLELENEVKLANKGVTYCATCDGAFFRGVPHVVVGGGDSAMEEATFLTRFASKVYIIHRRDQFRASKIMAARVLENPKIEVQWNSVVVDVLDVAQGKVTGVVLKDTVTGATRTLACGAVFVAIGHVPQTQPFAGQIKLDDNGFVVLDGASSRTTVEGVFAAGDCADHVYRQAITAAGMGCRAAIDAERWLEARHH